MQDANSKMSDDKFKNLPDDMKAKLKGCETPEEVLALAHEEGYELSDDQLDAVSGGGIWGTCGSHCSDHCYTDGRNIGE